jgi:hypothetical protein
MAKKLGRPTGGSAKKTKSGEWEATIRFDNGVEGTGRGRTQSDAQRAAVADARSKGGSGVWLLIAAALILGAAI